LTHCPKRIKHPRKDEVFWARTRFFLWPFIVEVKPPGLELKADEDLHVSDAF